MAHLGDIRSALIEEITSAFADVERGDGVSLHEADVIDNDGSQEQRIAARQEDNEGRWRDVPESDMEYYYWILPSLDAKGFHYYLPAYMVWSLRHYQTSASSSVDFILYHLTPTQEPGFIGRDLSRFEVFTPGQSQAICRFLQFMADNGDGIADDVAARRALDSYWGRFCHL